MPMAMIVIGDLFTGAERAKWQGVFGGVFGLASILEATSGWMDCRFVKLALGILH